VQGAATPTCEDLNAHLIVEFGILHSGRLQYVEVVRSSGYALYDDYAVRAIRAASPYPPVPADVIKEGSTGVPIRTAFNYVTHPRLVGPGPGVSPLPSPRSVPRSVSMLTGILGAALLVGAAICARRLWRRRRPGRAMTGDRVSSGACLPAPSEGRRTSPHDVAPAPAPNAIAHEALRSHGWRDAGDTAVHGLETSTVRAYSHPALEGHRVYVSPAGAWEHTKIPGTPARGSTPEELAHHLGAIHGTLSIADLHLPGRRAE